MARNARRDYVQVRPDQTAAVCGFDWSAKSPMPTEPPGAVREIEWSVSDQPVDYPFAVAAMEQRVAAIAEGRAREHVWLLEHPALYSAGTSARPQDLLETARLPVFQTGRGGQYTYHGPGQRVAYVLLDVRRRQGDVRAFITSLERWIIDTLAAFNVAGETRSDRVGVWVARPERGPGREDKIAAIGIRLRRWISYHGISINLEPDLAHFDGIVPCGIKDHGVTSLVDLGRIVSMTDLDMAMAAAFEARFGPLVRAAPLSLEASAK